jgi:hypothetical protein
MRILFTTAPIPALHKHHKTGELLQGTAHFTATLYEPDEPVPNGPSGVPDAKPVSYWRSATRSGQPIHVPPPYDGLPRIDIPRELTDGLPETAWLQLAWFWTQGGR